MNIRALTVSDLHQSVEHYQRLASATEAHKPDLVAFVGDFLGIDATGRSRRLSIAEAATALSALAAPHLIFVRGNHEEEEWREFVDSWPMERRVLTALYGSAFKLGPFVAVGFPCDLGWEEPWRQTLPKVGNELSRKISLCGRKALPAKHERWLPQLLRQTGPGGITLWLMHEPPLTMPLATPQSFNPEWTDAVEQFQPLLVVSGHDHETPMRFNAWHSKVGDTICVNPGQGASELHYCVLDFEFASPMALLPHRITVKAFPWRDKIVIQPS